MLNERQRRRSVSRHRIRPPLQPLSPHEAYHASGNSAEPAPSDDAGLRRRRCDGPSPPRSRTHAAGRTRGTAMSATVVDRIDVTTTDVAVIGAGAAGLSAALGLAPYRVPP